MNLFQNLFKSFKKDSPEQSNVDSDWRRCMSGVKKILVPHMKYNEMKPFCRDFLMSGPLPPTTFIAEDADWDVLAPLTQDHIGKFINYCRVNLETWECK